MQVIDRGVPVMVEEGVLRLEEDRRYELSTPGSDAAWLERLPLPVLGAGRFGLAIGRWVSPRALTLRHDHAGVERGRVPVVVVPRGEKLSESAWEALLRDLERWLPGVSVGTEGGTHGAVGASGASAPLIAMALTPLVPALLQAVAAVAEAPRRHTVAVFAEEPLRRARRADRESIRWVGRHPDVAAALDAWRDSERAGAEPRWLQGRAEDRLDHPVNRYAAWLLGRVVAVLRRTAEALASLADGSGEDDGRAWCSARARDVGHAAAAIERAVDGSFLAALAPAPPSEAALLVIADDPVYARLHHLGRRFVSPLFALDGAGHAAAARPSFELYEVWCLLALQRALATVLPSLAWRSHGLGALLRGGTGSGAGFVGDDAHGRYTIDFNPTFASWHEREGRPRWSLSGERRPDLVVTHRSARGARWVCLDAKWRVGRDNLADAFTSVHIYRDALRDDSAGGPCVGAALLSPACRPGTEDWFSAEFRDRFGCGAFVFAPGLEGSTISANWLIDTLRR